MGIGFILGKLVLLFLPRHSSLPSCDALERQATAGEFPPKTRFPTEARDCAGASFKEARQGCDLIGALARAGISQPN